MRHSDERPQADSSPVQPAPPAPERECATANGTPARSADRGSNGTGLDAGAPPLPTLAAQGNRDRATAQEGQPATDKANHAADREQTPNTLPSPLSLTPYLAGGKGGESNSRGEAIAAALEGPGKGQTTALRLLRRAVDEQWDIPLRLQSHAVGYLERVLTNPDSTPRDLATATKCLVSMKGQNLALVRTALEAERGESGGKGPSVTVNVNVDATSGPLARIKRLQGETEGEGGAAGGDGPPVG